MIVCRCVRTNQQCSNLHSDNTLLQPNRTNTPVHTQTEQYTYIQSPAPEDECNNIRNMLSNKKILQRDIKLVQFIQLFVRILWMGSRIFLLPPHRTRQRYQIKRMHPPVHPLPAEALRENNKANTQR